jgi:hypothetical protein
MCATLTIFFHMLIIIAVSGNDETSKAPFFLNNLRVSKVLVSRNKRNIPIRGFAKQSKFFYVVVRNKLCLGELNHL